MAHTTQRVMNHVHASLKARMRLRPFSCIAIRCDAATQQAPSRTIAAPRVHVGVSQAVGPRPYMEDCNTVLTSSDKRGRGSLSIVGIFDGHGGDRTAKFAASQIPITLQSQPLMVGSDEDDDDCDQEMQQALRSAFLTADTELMRKSLSEPQEFGGDHGSTALVAVQRGSSLYIANAGDCRAVLACHGKEPRRLSRDHTPNDMAEQRRIRRCGGALKLYGHHGWRVLNSSSHRMISLGVCRGLGDFTFKTPRPLVLAEPDVSSTRLTPGDAFVVMASDGLWSVMSDSEAVAVAARVLECGTAAPGVGSSSASVPCGGEEGCARRAARALVEAALERGTRDNVTAAVLRLDWGAALW